MAEQRQGLGLPEIVLIAVALCVMTALGIATASAFTQGSSTVSRSKPPAVDPPVMTPLDQITPQAAAVAPGSGGARIPEKWIADMSSRTGIGATALQAYGMATVRLGEEQPACRLGWTTLAGVGGIETGHGTHGGASLLPDGRTSQLILGPALDGTEGTAAIPSTAESEKWHADDQWDHAVGPMQFIPSTWDTWQSDGNGDGTDDPNNIFDAAYAAGRYLCASGGDLTTGPGWSRAVFSYNHSEDYVRSVLAFANAYGSR